MRTHRPDGYIYNWIDNKNVLEHIAIVEKAIEWGIIKKAGAWLSFREFKVSGLENFIAKVEKVMLSEIRTEVFALKDNPPRAIKEDDDVDLDVICN